MSNIFDDVRMAVVAAQQAQRAVDLEAQRMALMLTHRLQASKVSDRVLRAFKKELERYNMHTGRWK
jgi:tRNA A-37 threonylcarbamoyl transferase component Bud32